MRGSLLKSFARTWRHHPTMQSATLTVLIGTFSVIAAFICIQTNLQQILSHWGESVQMTVYLQEGIKGEATAKIADYLKNTEAFERIDLVEKEEAAKRFRQQMGSFSASFMNDPDLGNPLPASFELKLKERGVVEKIVELAQKLTHVEGVDEVSYGQGWIENYGAFIKTFASGTDALMAILLMGGLFVVSNSIRSSIFQRRDEIEILELVGATHSMIRAPYLFEGAVMGLLAAVLAQLLCFGLYSWQADIFGSALHLWGLSGAIHYLDPVQIAGFLLFGAGFGWLGAFLCVRTLATGFAASERQAR